MIFKSIKWRLQIWYGLILVAVLVGFGVTAFQLERGRVLQRIDGELLRRANELANVFRPLPGRGRGPLPPGEQPRGPEQFERPEFGPPPDENDSRDPNEDLSRRKFQLPRHLAGLFDETDTNGFYFILFRRGQEFARSTNAPAAAPAYRRIWSKPSEPSPINLVPPMRIDSRGPLPLLATRGDLREVSIFTQHPDIRVPGEEILVGRSIAPELSALRFDALRLTTIGGCVLLFGLAGGWWIASRAMRPIQDISATAVKISAGDLSQRISTAETESELGQLASVLNSTFARLESAFAQQQQFTSDAAHELRTPVSVMLTQAQAALNRERTAPEYRETLEACQRAAQRMRRLIESLLALARLDAGQETMKRLNFDFCKTISDCVELVKPLAAERGVKISEVLESTEIIGDSERLAQVVTNLLTNAIQYNRNGGEVNLKLESQNGFAVLMVADNGAGISPEDLPRVFERFYRADKSRSTGGNGLGLSISKAIVEAHGGTIQAAGKDGAGTVFIVRLPAVIW